MALWRLFYHIVFATNGRRPLLGPPLGDNVCRAPWDKAEELGCLVHAIHVQPDHAHLVLSIPSRLAVSSSVGQLKGKSSHNVAPLLPPWERGVWQDGFGVFSFGEEDLPAMSRYVRDQERHHAENHLWHDLERFDDSISGHAAG